MRAVRVKRALTLRAGRQWLDEKLLGATRVHLEVKLASDWVLPRLRILVSTEKGRL